MGYTTEFEGQINIVPPLNDEEIDYLNKFADSRRMHRHSGIYNANGDESYRSSDIIDYNSPGPQQPGLWCKWVPTVDGSALEWNGVEKFYDSPEWMVFLIEHFLKEGKLASSNLLFFTDHILNGTIEAQGEDDDDRWTLVVRDNKVYKREYVFDFGD